jgi:hypothetical protein
MSCSRCFFVSYSAQRKKEREEKKKREENKKNKIKVKT